jgi:hypothetical protein
MVRQQLRQDQPVANGPVQLRRLARAARPFGTRQVNTHTETLCLRAVFSRKNHLKRGGKQWYHQRLGRPARHYLGAVTDTRMRSYLTFTILGFLIGWRSATLRHVSADDVAGHIGAGVVWALLGVASVFFYKRATRKA